MRPYLIPYPTEFLRCTSFLKGHQGCSGLILRLLYLDTFTLIFLRECQLTVDIFAL
jgi:hypothetical protein